MQAEELGQLLPDSPIRGHILGLSAQIKHVVHRVAAEDKAISLYNLLTGPERTGPASLGKLLIVTAESECRGLYEKLSEVGRAHSSTNASEELLAYSFSSSCHPWQWVLSLICRS